MANALASLVFICVMLAGFGNVIHDTSMGVPVMSGYAPVRTGNCVVVRKVIGIRKARFAIVAF
jgi:hypothetical protein